MITKLNFTDRTIKSYAIRKLTPKECFRLMGVRDNVIGTMQSSNAQAAELLPDWKGKGKPEDMAVSASQQYKQAGNSIVVDVLATSTSNFSTLHPSLASRNSSRSSTTSTTRYPPCRQPQPTLLRKRFSLPRSPATTRSSWRPTCCGSGIPTSDGRARDGATSTNTPVRCTTSYFRSLPTVLLATSPR